MIREYEVLKGGMADLPEDPNSGHNFADPYKNRDPRFYRDCMFNGYKFQNKTAEFGISAPGGKIPAHNPTEASSYYTHVYSIKFATRWSLILTPNPRLVKGAPQLSIHSICRDPDELCRSDERSLWP